MIIHEEKAKIDLKDTLKTTNKFLVYYFTFADARGTPRQIQIWIQHRVHQSMIIQAMISCLLWLFAVRHVCSEQWVISPVSEQWHKDGTYCFQTESLGNIKPNQYNDYPIKPRIYEPWQ